MGEGSGNDKGKVDFLEIEFIWLHKLENIDQTDMVHTTTSENVPGCMYVLQLSAARAAAISDCTACNSTPRKTIRKSDQ